MMIIYEIREYFFSSPAHTCVWANLCHAMMEKNESKIALSNKRDD